ncbi:MAG: acyltransferase [Bacteroides sp.]|nr:acyltransferase [Bacteroides sp.]
MYIIPKHSKTIDLIRGVSAILIVLYHYTYRYNQNPYIIGTHTETNWSFTINWGYGAVVTFFIISGYLFSKYLNNTDIIVNKFLKKRLWRLYPTFWFCMTITTIVLHIIFQEAKVTIYEYLINLTMMPGMFKIKFIDGAYWTMAYEIKFAILYSIILMIRNIYLRKTLLISWIIISIISSLWITSDNYFFKFLRVFLIVDWIQVFIIGICIYQLQLKNRAFYYILLLLCFVNQLLWLYSYVHWIFLLITILILIFLPNIEKLNIPNYIYKPLEFIALISYPLYLLHQMIGFAIIKYFQQIGLIKEFWIFIPISISIILAYLVHRFVELPTSRMDFKFWPKLYNRN